MPYEVNRFLDDLIDMPPKLGSKLLYRIGFIDLIKSKTWQRKINHMVAFESQLYGIPNTVIEAISMDQYGGSWGGIHKKQVLV
jgi:hypothetical protein